MDINWLGLMKSAAISVVCLGGAILLLRDARRRAMRNQNRTTLVRESYVYCAHGAHTVNAKRAVLDGHAYDGTPIYLCHPCRFKRKRLLMTERESA